MKCILSAVLVLSLGSIVGFAQTTLPAQSRNPAVVQHQRHAHNPHKAAMRMGKKLGLTEEQTSRLEPILSDRQQKVQALRANSSLTDAEREQQMKTIQQTARMQMSNVLSPDQMKQLKQMHREKKQQGGAPTGV